MCLGMQCLIPLTPPPLFKYEYISKLLILGRKCLLGFFAITLNQHYVQSWIFECFVCQISLVLSVNQITRSLYLNGSIQHSQSRKG